MPSFFSLPAELRIQVYSHLLPGLDHYPSAYTGLRNSCHLIRKEYDHEAAKIIPHIYDNSPLRLSPYWRIGHAPYDPKTISDITRVELQPTPFVVTRLARFPKKIIPWHWTWIKTLIISFDMSWRSTQQHHYDYESERTEYKEKGALKDPANWLIQSAVRMAFERMDKMIKDRNGTTVNRRTFTKGDSRPRKCEIDTFVMRLDNFAEQSPTTPLVIFPPKAALPSNHDRLWDVSFGFNVDGGFVEAVWRRRTQADAQRDAENDFMPIDEWLAPVYTCAAPQKPIKGVELPRQRTASL